MTTQIRFSSQPRVAPHKGRGGVVRGAGQGDGGGDGVGLVAALGRRAPSPDMAGEVVGGQLDGAVSLIANRRDRPVGVDGRGRPRLSVADRFPVSATRRRSLRRVGTTSPT